MPPRLELRNVGKSFTMHLRDGLHMPVIADMSFAVAAGECVVLGGPSGVGKSSVLKMVFGNYGVDRGQVLVANDNQVTDVASAAPREVLRMRRDVIGYVSQFLRVVPRVSIFDIVAEPLLAAGHSLDDAHARAAELLSRLNLPERLWTLPPATFSGGEQQRVNVARGFIRRRPLMLLDEPTASLDAVNRSVVVDLVGEAKRNGTSFLGIFHDEDVREAVADRIVDVTRFAVAQAS